MADSTAMDWRLESDPAILWQTLRRINGRVLGLAAYLRWADGA